MAGEVTTLFTPVVPVFQPCRVLVNNHRPPQGYQCVAAGAPRLLTELLVWYLRNNLRMFVIASVSEAILHYNRLLRRFAPRNDTTLPIYLRDTTPGLWIDPPQAYLPRLILGQLGQAFRQLIFFVVRQASVGFLYFASRVNNQH